MKRVVVAMIIGLAARPVAGDTIDLTQLAHLNTGATSARVGSFTLRAEGGPGYLQFTGYGVGHTGGDSRDEVDYPDVLTITFDDPVTLHEATVGRLQDRTPLMDGPSFLPWPELAGFSATRHDGTTVFPYFAAGASVDGWRSVPLEWQGVRQLQFWGIGRQFGVWGHAVHGASLAGLRYSGWQPPTPPPVPPENPRNPDPPVTPRPEDPPPPSPPPTPVPEPSTTLLLGAATLAWFLRREAKCKRSA